MARVQTLVQLTDSHLAVLDEHATRLNRSRSDLIREAVDQYLADALEAEIDRKIVAGYRKAPPKEIWGDEPVRRLIEAEPW